MSIFGFQILIEVIWSR